jgi:hypothetical protein
MHKNQIHQTNLYGAINPTGCHNTIKWMTLDTVHNCEAEEE